MVKCLKFWIAEPPENTSHLFEASDALCAAYNAMLRTWELQHREQVVARAEASRDAYRAWAAADPETRGEKPKAYSLKRDPEFNSMRVEWEAAAREAAPTLSCAVIQQMKQERFQRDVDLYLERRFFKHEKAGLRHEPDGLVIGLNRTGCGFAVEETEGGAIRAQLPVWRLARGEVRVDARDSNDRWYTLVPVDRRDRRGQAREWTLKALQTALATGGLGGCKLIPPKRGAPEGKRSWRCYVTVTLPGEEREECLNSKLCAGVDFGVHAFAVYSCPERETFRFFTCRKLRRELNNLRARMKGVPRPKELSLGRTRQRRQDHYCRTTAREIVEQCIRDGVGTLKVEDLSGIRASAGDDADRAFMLSAHFPVFLFQTYLEQYCERAGVKLVLVAPEYTSQTCSRCGVVAAENRIGKRFECLRCGYRADSDLNAANNIAGWTKASTRSKRARRHLTPTLSARGEGVEGGDLSPDASVGGTPHNGGETRNPVRMLRRAVGG